MQILVTGGSGLVGTALSKLVNTEPSTDNFIFLSSKMCDLRDSNKVDDLFEKHNPDVVIHCASIVAGLYGNIDNNYTMLVDNLKINTNILESCRKYNVKRVINLLSTCVFGNQLKYPLTSNQINDKLPDISNEGYSYSKRILCTASKLLSQSSDIEVVNLIPTNLYGSQDNYNLDKGHVLPALIHKLYTAQQYNKPLIVKGDGSACRQFVLDRDLAKVILHFVRCVLPNSCCSLIVGPPVEDEITIKELVNKLATTFDFQNKIVYDISYSNGQPKKTVSDEELLVFLPNFKFTNLDDGLHETIHYFIDNFHTVRK